MAKGSNIEFRVGVIVLLGIILLVWSLYWLQGYRLERNSQILKIRFDDVGTLAVGDKVTVSGVRKGKVSDLRLTDNGVLVELQLYQDVVLRHDAEFRIRNLGLMGERFIAIFPGHDSVRYDPTITAEGRYDTGLPEVMGLMSEMVAELRQVVGALRTTVASDSSLNRFNRSIANFESLSQSMASYMERNQSKLDKTADNFLSASTQFKQMMTNNRSSIDSAAVRFDRISGNLDRFVLRLDSIAVSFRTFADALDEEDGTLQLLVEDRRLYDDLRKAADNIDDLITDIRANPRKYINLKVELF